MKLYRKKLSGLEITKVVDKYGKYFKVTVDIENKLIVIGCKLHADAVPLLIERGGIEQDVWGGWVNLEDKEVETNAVWNIRDDNPSMEVLDNRTREKFIKIVKDFFAYVFTK